eukprot:scaffold128_cov328-Pavlova_lutheri.AAC.6
MHVPAPSCVVGSVQEHQRRFPSVLERLLPQHFELETAGYFVEVGFQFGLAQPGWTAGRTMQCRCDVSFSPSTPPSPLVP